jgi:sugar phosphate isomerase/epimerase
MIYVSSACAKTARLEDALRFLHQNGFSNIECSGGSVYEEDCLDLLRRLKDAWGLNILCHNYFPVPRESFVLNLASFNEEVHQKSLQHVQGAIQFCRALGLKKFSFHAGFLMDIRPGEVGRKLSETPVFDRARCIEHFCRTFNGLKKDAGDVELYIENNVISQANLETFRGFNPFMLTSHADFIELKRSIDFKLLLDIGHLKVSARSLGLNFERELDCLLPETDYIHVSDNDAAADQNKGLTKDAGVWPSLKRRDLIGKVMTLEVYESLDALERSYHLLAEIAK